MGRDATPTTQLKERLNLQVTWRTNSRSPIVSKLDFPTYLSRELNEMSAEETSGDEQEVNEIARNKRWGNNSGNYNQIHSNFNNN